MQAFSMILAGLTVVVAGVGTGGSSHAAERRSKMPTSDLLGEWRTPKGASPAVSIVFRGKTREVTIDGKAIAMTGGQLSVDGFQKLFHFQKLEMAGNGGESYTELGLTEGVLDSRDVLSGFYSEEDYSSEGERVRGFMAPVVLYKVSPAGSRR